MSQIDWSKAPAEATHWDCRQFVLPTFMRKREGSTHWMFYSGGAWRLYGALVDTEEAKLIKRPESWTGEGLPPVGASVEVHKGDYAIREESKCFLESPVTVSAVFKMIENGTDMVAVDGGRHRGCEVFRAACVKPARTPEQIAEDAKRKEWIAGIESAYGKEAADKCMIILAEFDNRKLVKS